MRRAVSGLRAWLVQRVTAVYMLLFLVFLLTHFLLDRPTSYLAWHTWIVSPSVSPRSFSALRCWRTCGSAYAMSSLIMSNRLPFALGRWRCWLSA